MSDRVFVDTNIILYAKDARDARKQSIADRLISGAITDGTLVVSAQVLNEFYVNVTQKLKPGLSREDARTVCRSIATVSCEPITSETISTAWSVQDRFGLSWWDSLVVAAAVLSGCARLVSEDLQNGLMVDGLRVVDPFV